MIDTVLAPLKVLGEWLAALQEQYPWLAPLSALVTILGAVLWLHGRIVGKAYRIRREVEEKNERLEADIAALKSRTKLLKERLPETAWEIAERERKDDNEESAIRALRRYMDTAGPRLSEMALQISRFHLGLATGRDRDRNLVPAERFALLAFHLDPRHGEAGELLKEVQQLRGGPPFEHVQFTDDMCMPEEDGYYRLPRTSEAVASLLADADTAIDHGHYRRAHALADVAFLSARRWTLGDREQLALAARYWRAMALQGLGRYDQALAEIDGTDKRPSILSLEEQSPDRGPTHPDTVNTRHLRASILQRLGRYDQALAEIDGTDKRPGILSLEEQSPDRGPTHPSTLTTRHLRASILQDLGRYDQALAEIDGTDKRPGILLAMEQSPDRGPTHPSTLTTRHLRASILQGLGRYDQALAEIDGTDKRPGILPVMEESPDFGPTHPSTLTTRYLRASILQSLGRYDQALAEIDGTDKRPSILSLEEQSPDRGPTHPSTLTTRHLRASILQGLGRYDQALAEIDGTDKRPGILPVMEESPDFGPTHPSTLTTRYLRASILQSLGRYDQALAEIDGIDKRPGILPVMEQSPDCGATHPSTLTTRYLRASILQSLGRYDQALAEIDGIDKRPGILSLEEQSPDCGATHPSTLTTRYLRASILQDLGRYDRALAEMVVSRRWWKFGGAGPKAWWSASGGEVKIGGRALEGLPTVDPAHGDLTGRQQRPEQHGGGLGTGQQALRLDPPLELLVQAFDGVRGPRRTPLLGRVAHEGEQALAGFFQARRDRPAAKLPLG